VCRVRKTWPQPRPRGKRLTIHQTLLVIGLPAERIYADQSPEGVARRKGHRTSRTTGFWERPLAELEALAADMQRVFKMRLRSVGHDCTENHAQAVTLIGAYHHARQLFLLHGVALDAAPPAAPTVRMRVPPAVPSCEAGVQEAERLLARYGWEKKAVCWPETNRDLWTLPGTPYHGAVALDRLGLYRLPHHWQKASSTCFKPWEIGPFHVALQRIVEAAPL
jgi:hypothetical protein